MSQIPNLGQTIYGSSGTYTTYPPYTSPKLYQNLFTEIASMFDLKNIEEHQLKLLNELYDSGDDSNKKIAVELFKYLMKESNKVTSNE